jgi:hypothetical protein
MAKSASRIPRTTQILIWRIQKNPSHRQGRLPQSSSASRLTAAGENGLCTVYHSLAWTLLGDYISSIITAQLQRTEVTFRGQPTPPRKKPVGAKP